jgi:hypothetical protein
VYEKRGKNVLSTWWSRTLLAKVPMPVGRAGGRQIPIWKEVAARANLKLD